jgi:hypothetical protein
VTAKLPAFAFSKVTISDDLEEIPYLEDVGCNLNLRTALFALPHEDSFSDSDEGDVIEG